MIFFANAFVLCLLTVPAVTFAQSMTLEQGLAVARVEFPSVTIQFGADDGYEGDCDQTPCLIRVSHTHVPDNVYFEGALVYGLDADIAFLQINENAQLFGIAPICADTLQRVETSLAFQIDVETTITLVRSVTLPTQPTQCESATGGGPGLSVIGFHTVQDETQIFISRESDFETVEPTLSSP